MKDESLTVLSVVSLHPSSFILAFAERSHSGLVHRSRKPEWVNAHRGFESHTLRHLKSRDELGSMKDENRWLPSIWKFGRLSLRCELLDCLQHYEDNRGSSP